MESLAPLVLTKILIIHDCEYLMIKIHVRFIRSNISGYFVNNLTLKWYIKFSVYK